LYFGKSKIKQKTRYMKPNRLEAFTDGVLAIIITIMVLELKSPEEPTIKSLLNRLPLFISYVISFMYVGIYWNNHHHLFQATKKINGKILWANLHLLFWLSLIPFATSWIGKNHEATIPLAAYGLVLIMCALAYTIMQNQIFRCEENEILKKAIGRDWKGKVSLVLYILGIILSFFNPWLAIGCYVIVAFLWLIPDQRIEKNLQ
jgi:uncharacterized membrane protein